MPTPSISLPALSTGAGKLAARATGAYAAVRRQFKTPIGKFEGIAEVLAGDERKKYGMDHERSGDVIVISTRNSWVPLHCIQPMYNLVKRQAEVEILPLAESENLAVISYNPLGGGILSGKYGKDRRAEEGRLVGDDMYQKRYGEQWMYDAAVKFARLARDNGYHPVSLAVAWVAHHPAVTAPIIGARNLDQLDASLAAAKLQMTPEWRAEISGLSPAPAVATDRLEDTL